MFAQKYVAISLKWHILQWNFSGKGYKVCAERWGRDVGPCLGFHVLAGKVFIITRQFPPVPLIVRENKWLLTMAASVGRRCAA